eukprot:TRINITY_DN120987_c0_g1_i1.p1 TRINITY_DN120987_c0_g1~~TRINITY_DN120987_c0_g1_i1.p1  ORF type:complete len:273 (-),score=62.92 TRINITY_DN120987_c0_g1_i1:97-915(-)
MSVSQAIDYLTRSLLRCAASFVAAFTGNRQRLAVDDAASSETAPLNANGPTEEQKLSATQLAALLGNQPPEDEVLQEELPNKRNAAEVASEATELRRALEGSDSGLAARLAKGASAEALNILDELGRSVLLLGTAQGHSAACQAILSRPEFIWANKKDMIGNTALHLAAGNDYIDICQDILACPRFSAGIDVKNDRGQTPLDFAKEFGDGEAAIYLQGVGGTGSGVITRRQSRIVQAGNKPPCRNGSDLSPVEEHNGVAEDDTPITDMASLD